MKASHYDAIDRALEPLRVHALDSISHAPGGSPVWIAAAVDRRGRVHVARLKDLHTDLALPADLEYSLIETTPPSKAPVAWQKVTRVRAPQFVSMDLAGDSPLVGVVAATEWFAQPGIRVDPRDAFLASPSLDGVEQLPFGSVGEAMRLAVAPDGELLALARVWEPSVAMHNRVDLKLLRVPKTGDPSVLEPVPGTHELFYSGDYALAVTADRTAHIVVEGTASKNPARAPGPGLPTHLFYLAVEPSGRTAPARDLGPVEHGSVLTRIFITANRSGYVLVVAGDGKSGKLSARVLPLWDTSKPPVADEHYFVDAWMQLHSITIRAGDSVPRYYGPTAIRIEKTVSR